MTVQEDGDGGDAIEISDLWWEKLTALPFISCKWIECFIIDIATTAPPIRIVRAVVMTIALISVSVKIMTAALNHAQLWPKVLIVCGRAMNPIMSMLYCAENKGKTLHLLKKASKAVPQSRKCVKRDIFASPLDFQQRHPDFAEERKAEEPEM